MFLSKQGITIMENTNNYSHTLKVSESSSIKTSFFPVCESQKIQFKSLCIFNKFEGVRIDTNITADYQKGLLTSMSIQHTIINANKAGKKFLLGIDVSDDHQVHLDLNYIVQGTSLKLKEFAKGATVLFREDDKSSHGLLYQIVTPIPLFSDYEAEFGEYNIPYLTDVNERQIVIIPRSVIS